MQTRYDFTLPRGYVDDKGEVHRTGTMRLATARDELEPLRDPTIDGPDDPRLTIVVLARVVERLGTLELVTRHEIEGLFAADLAFLQDFYGVINFGSQEEYEELLAAQRDAEAPVTMPVVLPEQAAAPVVAAGAGAVGAGVAAGGDGGAAAGLPVGVGTSATVTYGRRSAIEEIPSDGR
ncbi:hypothetical protein [Cellulomonas sp. NTE-D12]|uniref:hypothetical protein n=1 Tax=Cellulomonas sp. NTE-D12 TaxID=2962632 RepID=UPI0030816C07|nr:hypothetical protein CELD12_02570 [Cellulomonas sp. NTE-D12]